MQVTRPKTVMLGNIPGSNIYRNLDHYKDAVRVPGFLILSIEAPINFANTTYLNERLVINAMQCKSQFLGHFGPVQLLHPSCKLLSRFCFRISRWIEDYEAEEETKKPSTLRYLILDLSGKYYRSRLLL